MYPETIPQNPHPYFTNTDVFPDPLMIVNGFILKDTLVGMHAQEFTEINIVLNGSGDHYIKNRNLPVKSGDVFFILPDYTHGYMGDQDFEVFNITVHKRFLISILPICRHCPLSLFCFKRSRFCAPAMQSRCI